MKTPMAVVAFVSVLVFSSVTGQYTLTGPSSAPEGSTVTFTCTTSPVQTGVVWIETSASTTNSYIYFYNSSGERCQRSSGSPPSDYTFKCNSTGVFSLSFPADCSRHDGSVFSCNNRGGSEESNNITLSVTDCASYLGINGFVMFSIFFHFVTGGLLVIAWISRRPCPADDRSNRERSQTHKDRRARPEHPGPDRSPPIMRL